MEKQHRFPRLRKRIRVFDSEAILQPAIIEDAQPFRQRHLFGMRHSRGIQHGGIDQTDGADDQGIAFPMANRKAHRQWKRWIHGAAGQIDHPKPAIPAMDDRHEIAVAPYLEWVGHSKDARHTGACAPCGLVEGRVAGRPSPHALRIHFRRLFVQWRCRSVHGNELLGRGIGNPNSHQGFRTGHRRTDGRFQDARRHPDDADQQARQNPLWPAA